MKKQTNNTGLKWFLNEKNWFHPFYFLLRQVIFWGLFLYGFSLIGMWLDGDFDKIENDVEQTEAEQKVIKWEGRF